MKSDSEITCKLLNPYGLDHKKWPSASDSRIVLVCFTIFRDQLLKLRQVLLLKKQKEITLLYVAESFCNYWGFCTPGSRGYYHILVKQMSAEQRDNDTFILLVIFLFEVVYLNYTELEQVHTYFIPTLCQFACLKSTA